MRWAGEVAHMGHRGGVYRTVVGNSDGGEKKERKKKKTHTTGKT
jgi:hypothetical protein